MKIIDVLFPPKCIVCGKLIKSQYTETPFCEYCGRALDDMRSMCSFEHFGQPVALFSCGTLPPENGGQALFSLYYVPARGDLPANKLIYLLKNKGERRCVKFGARILADMLSSEAGFIKSVRGSRDSLLITWIPRRRESVAERGFDHMQRVAKKLGKMLDIPVKRIIGRRVFSSEQKTLGAEGRRMNAENSFYIKGSSKLDGYTVIVIDDIITTGASFDIAAGLLRSHGAKQVISAAIAKTEYLADWF